MPEAVKISQLPVLSSVQPGDIVPIVDAGITQTSRCTASQIAALGGGAPGANTVNSTHLQDGAVTAAKVQFTGPDKLISRTLAGAGIGAEIVCTSYARGLLATANGPDARAYLDALQTLNNPAFTGQVFVPAGSANMPSYTFTGDTNTGMFSPAADNIALATNGVARLTINSTGVIQAELAGTDTLYNAKFVRAFLHLNGTATPPAAHTGGNHGFASIARTVGQAAGNYVVTFSTAMPDTNYVPFVSANVGAAVFTVTSKNTTDFTFHLREWDFNAGNPRWVYTDYNSINVVVIR
jgi:hypothetical protein